MSRDESGFLDIVAEYEQFAGDVDLALRPSEIGAGEYTVVFTKFTLDKVVSRDVENAVAKATFEIMVGNQEGDSFMDTFWFPRGAGETNYAHRGLLLLARCVCGRPIRSLTEAIEVLKTSAGDTVLTVNIVASTGKGGQIYHNVQYNGRVDSDQ